jgi:hypothetical protein
MNNQPQTVLLHTLVHQLALLIALMVTSSSMDNTASNSAAITAMAQAMSGVLTDDITITSITDVEIRRLNILPKHLTTVRQPAINIQGIVGVTSTSVLYEISVILEKLGSAYDHLHKPLSPSRQENFKPICKLLEQPMV